MQNVATIGLDIAKDVFQIHAADASGEPLISRKLRRAELLEFFEHLPPCLVGMEACGSSHYWARCIATFGHSVRLIHPQYVKAFVKRGKTDANDAEAISEAVSRKSMRFVPIKSAEQQAVIMLFRTRTLFVRQRVQGINALRNHLAELGIVARVGTAHARTLMNVVKNEADTRVPLPGLFALTELVQQIEFLQTSIAAVDREICARAKRDDDMRRLMTIPGVGPIISAAIKAFVQDPATFKSSRHFAAWLGLTPKAHSSGGNMVLGRISKMGNVQLRSLLVGGATSVLRVLKDHDPGMQWLVRLRSRRPFKVVAVALANKMARVIWALLVKGGEYGRPT